MMRRIDYLRLRPAWRLLAAVPVELDDFDERRGAWDCPISTRRHHERIAAFRARTCDASIPLKIAPPRYVVSEAFEHPVGDVERISAHPNAAVVTAEGFALDPAKVERARFYVDTMQVVERRARHALNRNRLVVISGDLNMGKRVDVPWSPVALARRLDLRVWAVGVDYILSDKRLRVLDRQLIASGMDHPWMREEYARA